MILVDGVPTSTIPASDRGLLFGDGLFETILSVNGDFPLWARHVERLRKGCEVLDLPFEDFDHLIDEARRVVQQQPGLDQCAVVRITVTRGSGGRGYAPPTDPQIRRIVQARPWPERPKIWWREGVRVDISPVSMAVGGPIAGLKHLNRLEQVLARSRWPHPQAIEALMLDHEGYLVEGTMTNVFLVEGKRLITPPLDRCGVSGIMRGLIMEQAPALGLKMVEQSVRLPRLLNSDGAMLTNAVIGAWPVRSVGDRELPVPDVIRKIQTLIENQLGFQP